MRGRRRAAPATSLTRINAGLPQAATVPADTARTRRGIRPSMTYTRGGYLAHSRRDPRVRQTMFRVG